MQDFVPAFLFAVMLTFGVILVSSESVAVHTDAVLPQLVTPRTRTRLPRSSLIAEAVWGLAILGSGEVVVLLALFHPASTLAVRLVAAAQLIIVGAWLLFLGRRVLAAHRGDQ